MCVAGPHAGLPSPGRWIKHVRCLGAVCLVALSAHGLVRTQDLADAQRAGMML